MTEIVNPGSSESTRALQLFRLAQELSPEAEEVLIQRLLSARASRGRAPVRLLSVALVGEALGVEPNVIRVRRHREECGVAHDGPPVPPPAIEAGPRVVVWAPQQWDAWTASGGTIVSRGSRDGGSDA